MLPLIILFATMIGVTWSARLNGNDICERVLERNGLAGYTFYRYEENRCYLLIWSLQKSWDEAQKECKNITHTRTNDNQSEWYWVTSTGANGFPMSGEPQYWGQIPGYVNPNDGLRPGGIGTPLGQDCGQWWRHSNPHGFDDLQCHVPLNFLCELALFDQDANW